MEEKRFKLSESENTGATVAKDPMTLQFQEATGHVEKTSQTSEIVCKDSECPRQLSNKTAWRIQDAVVLVENPTRTTTCFRLDASNTVTLNKLLFVNSLRRGITDNLRDAFRAATSRLDGGTALVEQLQLQNQFREFEANPKDERFLEELVAFGGDRDTDADTKQLNVSHFRIKYTSGFQVFEVCKAGVVVNHCCVLVEPFLCC